jgi:hypothetical protein
MPRARRTPRAAGEGGGEGQGGNGKTPPAAAGGSRVLIVHRSLVDRRRLIASFTANGFRTKAVASVAAARKAVQREAVTAAGAGPPFDLAVIERALPDVDALRDDLVRAGISVIEVDEPDGSPAAGNA